MSLNIKERKTRYLSTGQRNIKIVRLKAIILALMTIQLRALKKF